MAHSQNLISMSGSVRLELLVKSLKESRDSVVGHPIYTSVVTADDVRKFRSQHVFAVWDFMCLLKRLQRSLTSVDKYWLPSGDPLVRRFINEIVLEEESGDNRHGGYLSHFELYLEAMSDSGADRVPVNTFIERIRLGETVESALSDLEIADETRSFVNTTWHFVDKAPIHAVASAFAFGREEVIPEMFVKILRDLSSENSNIFEKFCDYLELHIELDGDTHGPLALRMLESLCGDDEVKWNEAQEAALLALNARKKLWDGVVGLMPDAIS